MECKVDRLRQPNGTKGTTVERPIDYPAVISPQNIL